MQNKRVKRPRFTRDEIAVIKGMALRGDKQSDIAVWFSWNQGRINEVLKRDAGRYIHIAPALELPPAGPYRVVPVTEFARVSEAAAIPLRIVMDIQSKLEAIETLIRGDHGPAVIVPSSLPPTYIVPQGVTVC